MVYTGKSMAGTATPGHMLDLAIAGIAAAGAMTTIAPADYRAIGVPVFVIDYGYMKRTNHSHD